MTVTTALNPGELASCNKFEPVDNSSNLGPRYPLADPTQPDPTPSSAFSMKGGKYATRKVRKNKKGKAKTMKRRAKADKKKRHGKKRVMKLVNKRKTLKHKSKSGARSGKKTLKRRGGGVHKLHHNKHHKHHNMTRRKLHMRGPHHHKRYTQKVYKPHKMAGGGVAAGGSPYMLPQGLVNAARSLVHGVETIHANAVGGATPVNPDPAVQPIANSKTSALSPELVDLKHVVHEAQHEVDNISA